LQHVKADVYDLAFAQEDSHWWYTARRRILRAEVETCLREVGGTGNIPRLLDFGCGTGGNLQSFSSAADAYGVDVSSLALEYCRRRGLTRVAVVPAGEPIGNNPFRDPFDVVVMADVLEHVDEEQPLLRELAHWMRPGGWLIVTVPAYGFLWSGEDYVSNHRRRYRARGLARMLTATGFEVARLTYFNTLLFPAQVATVLANRLFRPRSMYETVVKEEPKRVNTALGAVFGAETRILG
jgi:SAM-dependent methyltransferase